MHCDFALLQGDLQSPVVKVTEEEKPVRVPGSELEAHRHCVVIGSPWQLQETGGIEEDREGVGLHAGEGQIALCSKEIQRSTKRARDWRVISGSSKRKDKHKTNPRDVDLHHKLPERFKSPMTLLKIVGVHTRL